MVADGLLQLRFQSGVGAAVSSLRTARVSPFCGVVPTCLAGRVYLVGCFTLGQVTGQGPQARAICLLLTPSPRPAVWGEGGLSATSS